MKRFSLAREILGGGVSALAAIPLIIACAMIVAAPLREFMFPIVLQSAIVSAIDDVFEPEVIRIFERAAERARQAQT